MGGGGTALPMDGCQFGFASQQRGALDWADEADEADFCGLAATWFDFLILIPPRVMCINR